MAVELTQNFVPAINSYPKVYVCQGQRLKWGQRSTASCVILETTLVKLHLSFIYVVEACSHAVSPASN